MTSIKTYLAGDYTNPGWHPVTGVDSEIREILFPAFDVECHEHYESLDLAQMQAFGLIILYTDHWGDKSPTVPALASNYLNYVAGGGKLLVIHYPGISLDAELAQMVGAAFKMHPPFRQIRFVPVEGHTITQGMPAFEIADEAYMFTWDPLTDREIFLNFEHEGQLLPAGWTVRFGLGNLIYLSPGHNQQSFQNPVLRELIRRAACWLCPAKS